MKTDRELMQQALEALKGVLDESPKVLDASISGGLYEVVQCREAIALLRERLAQPEPLEYWTVVEGWIKIDEVREHFDSVGCGTIYKTAGEGRAPLYTAPPPCPTCEALARTVMMDQTAHDKFKPDWDAMAVMVEEQQRMAKRIVELEALLERQTALLERQTARIVELQEHIENFDGEDR